MSSDAADGVSRFWSPDVSPARLERLLWIVVAISLVADVVTTFVGLRLGLTESNPVARRAIEAYGPAGLLALKGGAIALGVACRPLLPRAQRAIVPAGLAAPWTIAVGVNLVLISSTL